MRDPLAGRRAPRVRQHLRVFDQISLTFIVLRHLPAETAEALFEPGADLLTENQFTAQRGRYGIACYIVFRGTQSTGDNHNPRARHSASDRIGQASAFVTDNGFPNHLNTQRVKLIR